MRCILDPHLIGLMCMVSWEMDPGSLGLIFNSSTSAGVLLGYLYKCWRRAVEALIPWSWESS